MQEIKLRIEDENLETVITILNNLKDGLISNIMAFGLWLDKPDSNKSYLEDGNLYII